MPETTPRLGMHLVAQSQSRKDLTVNAALIRLDLTVQIVFPSLGLNTPPTGLERNVGSEVNYNNNAWIVGQNPTGNWKGKAGTIAYWYQNAWRHITPLVGWTAYIIDHAGMFVYNGSNWVALADQTVNVIGPDDIGPFGSMCNLSGSRRLTFATPGVYEGEGIDVTLNIPPECETTALNTEAPVTGTITVTLNDVRILDDDINLFGTLAIAYTDTDETVPITVTNTQGEIGSRTRTGSFSTVIDMTRPYVLRYIENPNLTLRGFCRVTGADTRPDSDGIIGLNLACDGDTPSTGTGTLNGIITLNNNGSNFSWDGIGNSLRNPDPLVATRVPNDGASDAPIQHWEVTNATFDFTKAGVIVIANAGVTISNRTLVGSFEGTLVYNTVHGITAAVGATAPSEGVLYLGDKENFDRFLDEALQPGGRIAEAIAAATTGK